MPGPLAPYLDTIRAANVEGAMDPETLRRVIALTESVGAVIVRRGNYRIDPQVERFFVPEAYRPLIAAAVAFCKLPEHDLNTILSALAPSFPKAAVLLAFTVPAGAVAKLWIDQVQGFVRSRAVKLELLFWVVPWVGPTDES